MTVETADAVQTPTVRRALRRWVFWIAALVVALLVALVGIAVFRVAATPATLSASSAAPTGAKAVAQVLRQQGVTVTETETLDATSAAIDDPTTTTVLVYDPDQVLDDDQAKRLGGLADRVVLVDPDFGLLRTLAPAVAQAGSVTGTRTADCDLPAVVAAGTVTADGAGFRVIDDTADVTPCLAGTKQVYSLIESRSGGLSVTVLGTTSALDNEHVRDLGNAALALTLLGSTTHLVWYLPSPADIPGGAAPTLADLTPTFVTPLIALGLLVAAAAAVWRGRRFGALVIENLPVTVRASETMEGRSRLYAASGARLHALDALRVGTIDRIGRQLGLPRAATVDEVCSAITALTLDDPRVVRALLLDSIPATDTELVRQSDELLRLESRVSSALNPTESLNPTERMGP